MTTTKTTYTKVQVLDWKRENNTVNGNPVFSFEIVIDGKIVAGKTRPNSSFVYGLVSYPEALANVVIAVTPSGRVYMDGADRT